MRHVYKIDSGRGIYWEVWQEVPGIPWGDTYCDTLETQEDLKLYIDNMKSQGLDFVIHPLEVEDDYVSLSK